MSSISHMPFNTVEDYVDELEEKIKNMELDLLNYKSIVKSVAYILKIDPNTPGFKLSPVMTIADAIEELQNAQTTKQA